MKNLFAVSYREAVKNYLAENHFAKKPLAEMGGTPPPQTENRRKFPLKNG